MTKDYSVHPTLIDVPMPIITPRLIIRPVMPGDGGETHAAKIASWDDIRIWMPWAKSLGTVDEDEISIREACAKFILREDFRMVAVERESGRMAVFTGLHRFDPEIRRFEIGYWAHRDFRGKGLVTEATVALIHYAFNALSARTVAICHADGNEPSRRVIERAGFHYEGRLRNDTILPDGTIKDRLVYSHTDIRDVPALDVRWDGEMCLEQ